MRHLSCCDVSDGGEKRYLSYLLYEAPVYPFVPTFIERDPNGQTFAGCPSQLQCFAKHGNICCSLKSCSSTSDPGRGLLLHL